MERVGHQQTLEDMGAEWEDIRKWTTELRNSQNMCLRTAQQRRLFFDTDTSDEEGEHYCDCGCMDM